MSQKLGKHFFCIVTHSVSFRWRKNDDFIWIEIYWVLFILHQIFLGVFFLTYFCHHKALLISERIKKETSLLCFYTLLGEALSCKFIRLAKFFVAKPVRCHFCKTKNVNKWKVFALSIITSFDLALLGWPRLLTFVPTPGLN